MSFMTKRHYDFIATVLLEIKPSSHWNADKASQHFDTVKRFAERLQIRDQKFDRARFFAACGLKEVTRQPVTAKPETTEQRSAYHTGYCARRETKPATANPYLCGTSPENANLCNWWRDGWLDAANDERNP